jgi:hypothetical protein
MAVLLGAYAVVLNFGPSVAQPFGLVVQVLAQKAATVVLILALLMAAVEIDQGTSRS